MKPKSLVNSLIFLLVISGCQQKENTVDHSKKDTLPGTGPEVKQQGVASWYGEDFHGKETASGEIYNQNAMTAASKTLPLGSTAKVTAVETGKSVIVKINDRGPYIGNRVLDLSKAAANKIGLKKKGVGKVKILARKPHKKRKSRTKH